MATLKTRRTRETDLSWLGEVQRRGSGKSEDQSIWVRETLVTSGPAIPGHPDSHPYCEICLVLEGRLTSLMASEEADVQAGDLFLIGPHVPHWAKITTYPLRCLVVHFLPAILLDAASGSEGREVLGRFMMRQGIDRRIIRLPEKLEREFEANMRAMAEEFSSSEFGSRLRLHGLLLQTLVQLLRAEREMGRSPLAADGTFQWEPLARATTYIRKHYSEPVYSHAVAAAAGVSETKLKSLFRRGLGTSWVHFLQGYRVERAAALLATGDSNVTEAAFAVGFESLSHFNSTFRRFMNVTPARFLRQVRN